MFRHLLIAALLTAFSSSSFAAGVAMGSTRVIYNGNKKETSLSIQNKSQKEDFLIQAWMDDATGNKKTPFVITPPLFELEAGKNNVLRIVKIKDGLPQDRESVYWINVKAIPPRSDDNAKNVLQIAVRTRLKLFYRPAGLQGNPVDYAGKLAFARQGNRLNITNPSAFNISFQKIAVDGKEISHPGMVPAKGNLLLPLPGNITSASSIRYVVITDFGSGSEPFNQTIH